MNKQEEKIVAKNEPVIDSIGSGTTYYNTNNKRGDKVFMIGIFVVAAIFIFFLPNIYNFIHGISLKKITANVPSETEKTPDPVVPDDGNNTEDTYVAKVCTKATSNDVVTAHTLYFSASKLMKASLSETYTLGSNYNSSELDTYYNERKQKFNGYDSISIETIVDDKTYNATAMIDLKESPKTVEDLMTVRLEYEGREKDILAAYELNGFNCE